MSTVRPAAGALRRSLVDVRARVAERRTAHQAQDGRAVLANGLAIHGATRGDVRSQRLMLGYFPPGFDVRPGMTVFDVGANIGLFSLEVLQRCDGDVELFAFEPAPEPFSALERNVHELFPQTVARLYRCALADRPGEATLYFRPRVSGTSSLSDRAEGDPRAFIDAMLREPPDEYREVFPGWFRRLPRPAARRLLSVAARWAGALVVETPCETATLSHVVREHGVERIDFLKIDVEGAELDVLRGIEEEDWPKVMRIAAEVHDVDGRVATIRAMLEDAGFEVGVQQEWPFEGTLLHLLHAVRRAPGEGRAS